MAIPSKSKYQTIAVCISKIECYAIFIFSCYHCKRNVKLRDTVFEKRNFNNRKTNVHDNSMKHVWRLYPLFCTYT